MRKTIVVALGVLVLVALALAIVPTTRDEVHWRWASYRNDTTSYESYVKAWPQGRHVAEARTRYDEYGWAGAEAAKTARGYERYLQLHGQGKHVAEAKDRLDSLHWQEAAAAKTVQGFARYLHLHREGKHVAEAKEKIDSLEWQEATAANTVEGFERYLERHGLHAEGRQVAEGPPPVPPPPGSRPDKPAPTARASERYVRLHADEKHVAEAAEAVATLSRTDRAKVVLDYPEVVHAGSTDGKYRWHTTLRETGGHAGFVLQARDYCITDRSGGLWSSSLPWNKTVAVGPGGKATVDHWFGKGHSTSGGTYRTVWLGRDDYGNDISITQTVKLAR